MRLSTDDWLTVEGFFLVLAIAWLFTLPTLIAAFRHNNLVPVMILNFLAGPLVFGWVIGLVLALQPLPPWHPNFGRSRPPPPKPRVEPAMARRADLRTGMVAGPRYPSSTRR